MGVKRYPLTLVQEKVHDILTSCGCDAEVVEAISSVLLEAELQNVRTHGLRLLPIYVQRIKNGSLNGSPNMKIIREHGGVACIDADNSPGPYSGVYAAERCVIKAKELGIAVVGVRKSNHFGIAGYYARYGAREGFITIATTNGSPAMAPHGAKQPFFAATPIAFGIPRNNGEPLVLDIALTQSSRARIRQYAAKGQDIPEGWALDADGNSTVDAQQALIGSLLPIGGHKGYGLAFMLEILTAIFTASNIGPDVADLYQDSNRSQALGHFFMMLKHDVCRSRDGFALAFEDLVNRLHELETIRGVKRVIVPGEIEIAKREEQLKLGLSLSGEVVLVINQELEKANLDRL